MPLQKEFDVVALKGRDIDAFLARPDAGRPIILLYGPDAGLVRERADALMASAVDDPNDPFSLVKLDGDELAAEPSRLVDEAMTVPLFGGRRAIRVRAGSRSFASGVDTLADMPLKDCRIVIEAGELRPESPLRKACERAKTAVAIACYPDTERDLAKLIDDELRVSDLRIAPDARAVLTALLGGDRQASRNELRKLALYSHGKGEVTLDDVMTVVSDASELKLDPIVDGAFAGKPDVVESEFVKAMVAGTYPGVIIMAAQRQAAWLHKSSLAVAEGTPTSVLLESGYPRVHFSRKANVEIALRNFSPVKLVAIIEQLATAAFDMRKQTALASAIAQRTLLAGDRRQCAAKRLASPRQAPHHVVELIEAAVVDRDAAAGIAVVDRHGKTERVADAFLQCDRIRVLDLGAAGAARLLRLALRHAFFMRHRFGLSHVEAFGDDALGGSERIGHADQRAGMAGGQFTLGDIGLYFRRQFGQPHHVGDVAAALADDLGDVFLAAFEFVRERVIALRLFHRVEVFALDVFDDRDFERFGLRDVEGNDRHFVQAGELGGAPAAFAGDDLKAIRRALHRAHHDRLDDAVLLDGGGELSEFGIGKCPARVARIRFQKFDRHLALAARPVDMRGLAADISDQTCKTAAQSRTRFVGHRQLPWIHSHHSGTINLGFS